MVYELVLGLGMVAITTVTHALFMVAGTRVVAWHHSTYKLSHPKMWQPIIISLLTIWMFIAIVLEAWLWAMVYLYNPLMEQLPDQETAMYFSMVTFTTVGYGDVVLTGNWRLLASIQAANGVIIFGWTTALLFYFIQRIYRNS